MASDDKEYEQSALGKRVNELMDDGYDFGEAVKQAMSEGLKDGGSVGIEILFKNKMADGGRVGLFMGGDPLTGQALNIYNSMNSYGFSDQEIANALQGQGLYTPGGTTTPDTPTTIQPIGYQGRGDDNPYAGQVVDQTDYSFNPKNYGPGQKLEINPAAVGMSFYDSTTGTSTPNKTVKEDKGIIGRTIDSFIGAAIPEKQLSQFTSPGTGDVLKGPAELGFMSQNIEGIPGNLTREDLRSMYDNYNKFLGRPSNFVDARVKGTAGNLINTIPYVGTIKKGAEALFGPQGNKSLQSKYTVDNAGFGNTGARDEFGLATFDKKDGFLGLTGNVTRDYVDRMQDKLNDLDDFFGSRIDDFDINNLTPDMLDKMSKINGFYTKQIQAYKQRLATENINKRTQDAVEAQRIAEELAAAAAAKDKAAALAAIKKQGQADYNPNIHGPTNYGRDSQGNQSFDFGGGFGIGSDGGPVSNKTGRGRTGYSEGGLATMFKRKK